MAALTRNLSNLSGFTGAPDETLLTPKEAAAMFGRSTVTLRKWSYRGEGPKRVTIAGRPFYSLGAVRALLREGEGAAA